MVDIATVEAFAGLMEDDCREEFMQWGRTWVTQWSEKRFYLAPEAQNRPWVEFVQSMSQYCYGKPWEEQAKVLWNTQYAPKIFTT